MRRQSMRMPALAAAAIAMAAAAAGCAGAAAPAPQSQSSLALPLRARALIRHCPELACTTAAEVPGCSFSEDVEYGDATIRADISCVRDGTATRCSERRTPVGGENQNLQAQRLDFRCSGDPLSCVVTGGNAVWPAPPLAAENASTPGGPITCHAPRQARPPHAPHRIPGPDTV